MSGVLYNHLNGRLTAGGVLFRDGIAGNERRGCRGAATGGVAFSYEDAKPQETSNHWSSTENSRNNARNVNFNTGNANNNNKYNGNVVRPVAALGNYTAPSDFVASVWEAYHDCMRGKRRSPQAVEYMEHAAEDIPRLAEELWTGMYHPGTSTCFLVRYPKLREVFAAGFRDRIVHHWICLRLEPLFEARFREQGNVSFNCRRGFGTEAAVRHVAEGMRRVSNNYRRKAWVFRGDLVGFFMSIDKRRLWERLERFIERWRARYGRGAATREEDDSGENAAELHGAATGVGGCYPAAGMWWDVLTRVTKVVVMHRPERDCVLNSPPEWWHRLAPNKSLFTSASGMPIGNLTTQLFANFYMSFFVLFVLWLFRGVEFCFAQFVDDFIIVCVDKRFLIAAIPRIEAFLREVLGLTLHRDKRYLQPVAHGVLFVGTFIKPGRLYLSNRTIGRMSEVLYGADNALASGGCDHINTAHVECVMNSYLGFCQRRRTYRTRRALIDGMGAGFWRHFTVHGRYERVRRRRSPTTKDILFTN